MKVPTHIEGKLPSVDKIAVNVVAKNIEEVQTVSAAIESQVITTVAQNVSKIAVVSGAIEDISVVAQVSSYLPQLTSNLDNLDTVAANLAPILNCSNNMATLLLLHARMADIEGIIPRLPDIATLAALDTELEGIYKIIPQIVTLVAHMELVAELGAHLPELEIIFDNLAELVALGTYIDEIVVVATNLPEILKVNGLVEEANLILQEIRTLHTHTQTLTARAEDAATAAEHSELEAYASQLSADASAVDALASEDAAKVAEINSTASALTSKVYSDTARDYANAADASRASAATEATKATQQASAASVSAEAALVSEGAAKASENAAKASQTAAKASETNSKTSETNAKASETVAVTKASEASTSASTADTKATEAANSATAANTAKEAAELAASTLAGGIIDKGAWDASTGVYPPKPTRPVPGGGTQPVSAFWKVTGNGTVNSVSFVVGDDLRYSASNDSFYKVDNSDAVTSVQGKMGAVTLTASEVGALNTPTGTHASARVLIAGTTANTAVYSAFTIDKSVPANAVFSDTVYTHPNNDGNRHVPASGTSNNRKFLMATATAGSYSWTAPLMTDIVGLATELAGKLGVTANAASASKLATSVTINGVSFDGSANISITAPNPNTLTRGIGLLGADYSGGAAATWRVAYGTSAGTAAEGNDPRLSDARTPLAHSHTASDVGALPITGGTLTGPITMADNSTLDGHNRVKRYEGSVSSYTHYYDSLTNGATNHHFRFARGDGTNYEAFVMDGSGALSSSTGGRFYSEKFKPTPDAIGASSAVGSIDFGGNQNLISTAQFLAMLESLGAFGKNKWTARGSWSYASNQTINDTGCGDIPLAGSVVEVMGWSSNECTIRITTPTTTNGGQANSEFIYVNNGVGYAPGWRKQLNSKNTNAATVGALPIVGGTLQGNLHTANGIYPRGNGDSEVGNAWWRFNQGHINNLYSVNARLEDNLKFGTGAGTNGVLKHQGSRGGESWITSIDDTSANHKAIGVSQEYGAMYWDGPNGLKRIYNESFKPTPADINAKTNAYKSFYLKGDSNGYILVKFPVEDFRRERIRIWRNFADDIGGSDPNWNGGSTTHFGACVITIEANGNAWGGSQPYLDIAWSYQYTRLLGSSWIGSASDYCVFVALRASPHGYGALYHFDYPDRTSVPDVTIAHFDATNDPAYNKSVGKNIVYGDMYVRGTELARRWGQSNWTTEDNAIHEVSGLLAWKNYGDGHVIFDASAGVTPSGTACDKNNSSVTWQSTHPTLMGWNGVGTFGVRVDTARFSDISNQASWAHNLNGTIATNGQDLLIHGKRGVVGDNGGNSLILNYGTDFGNGTSVHGRLYSGEYRGNSGVDGTGEAAYFPAGIYSKGTNWLYGKIITANNPVDAGTGGVNCGGVGSSGTITGRNVHQLYNHVGLVTESSNGTSPAIGFHKHGVVGGQILIRDSGTFACVNGDNTLYTNLEVLNLNAQSNVTAYSDRRVKANIKNIPDALNKVLALNGVIYTRTDMKDKELTHTGVIAQEVEAVLPEAVSTSKNGDIEDFKSVAYGNLVGLLIEAIKEQQAQINELKELINGIA